jgi:DNA-binding response OmpR family regulator
LPRTNGIPLSYLFEKPAAPLRNPDAPAVLVIEDDTQERSWLLETITEAGYIVETAATGAQALSRISSRKFDAVTLDLLLPDMSGWDVLRKLRGSGPNQNTPVIIATLVSERDSAAGFVVDDFLTKPLEAERLLASIEKAAVEPNAHRPLLLVEP